MEVKNGILKLHKGYYIGRFYCVETVNNGDILVRFHNKFGADVVSVKNTIRLDKTINGTHTVFYDKNYIRIRENYDTSTNKKSI